jgi:hypothetical protein
MQFPFARSLLLSCLVFAACAGDPAEPGPETPELVPPAPPPAPPATTVSFACGSTPVTFDLPCQVGLPLAGTVSAVECNAHAGGRTGLVTLLLDMGAPANQAHKIPANVHTPTFGDFREFTLLRGSVLYTQVDTAKRTFEGRIQDVAFTLDGVGTCQLGAGPLSGVAGNFL